MKKQNRIVVYLLVILLLGIFLRLINLSSFSLYGDEVEVVTIAQKNLGEIIHDTFVNMRGTLHYILLHNWINIFGAEELHLRWISILFGLCSIMLVFLVSGYLFGYQTALLASFLAAISSFIILFNRTIRWYSLLCFFDLAYIYNFIKAIKKNKIYNWISCVLIAVLGIYSRYCMIYTIIASMLVVLFLFRKEKKIFLNWIYFQFILSVVILISLSPYLKVIINQLLSYEGFFDRAPIIFGALGKLVYIIYSFWYGQNIMPYVYPIVIVGFFIFCAILSKFIFIYRNSSFHLKKNINVLLIFFLTPILFSSFSKHPAPHYYISAASLLMTFVSLSILSYRKKLFRIIIFILIVIIQSYSLYNLYTKRQYFRREFVDSWKEMASYVDKNLEPGNVVLYDHISFGYYFRKLNPALEKIGLEITTDNFLEIEEKIFKNENFKRIWFVNSPLSRYMSFSQTKDSPLWQLLTKYDFKLKDSLNFDEDADAEFKRKIIKRPFSRFRNTLYIFVKTD